MTSDTSRIDPSSDLIRRPDDIVIAIDAMGGDKGVAPIISGMGKSLSTASI